MLQSMGLQRARINLVTEQQQQISIPISRSLYLSLSITQQYLLIYISIFIYLCLLFRILFPYRFLQDIEQISLCYTVLVCLFYT